MRLKFSRRTIFGKAVPKAAPNTATTSHGHIVKPYLIAASQIALVILIGLFSNILTAFAGLSVSINVKNPDPYSGNQSWFVYERKAGEVIEDVASLKNYGTQPVNIHICSADGATNSSGSFILKFDYETKTGIGLWTETPNKPILIKPGERVDVPFKIKIPENAQPGQYIGGLIVESEEYHETHTKKINEKGLPVKKDENISYGKAVIATRIGARIYVTIPGEVNESINVKSFEYKEPVWGKPYFKFEITNGGNVSLEPMAEIKIFDSAGKLYDKINTSLGTSMPGSTISPIIPLVKKPSFGQFNAEAKITYKRIFQTAGSLHGAPLTASASTSFNIIPWFTIVLLLILVFACACLFICRRHSRKKLLQNCKKYIIAEGDDLMAIAETHHIPWKKIAKINGLKPPFIIKAGNTLLIPPNKNGKKQ